MDGSQANSQEIPSASDCQTLALMEKYVEEIQTCVTFFFSLFFLKSWKLPNYWTNCPPTLHVHSLEQFENPFSKPPFTFSVLQVLLFFFVCFYIILIVSLLLRFIVFIFWNITLFYILCGENDFSGTLVNRVFKCALIKKSDLDWTNSSKFGYSILDRVL